jgi:Putative restriction endonuclease
MTIDSSKLMPKVKLAEYLAWENRRPERNELVCGEVVPVADQWRVNAEVVGNLAGALLLRLKAKGGNCSAFKSSSKVPIDDRFVLYPDLLAACHIDDLKTDQVFHHPCFHRR